jgi:hypothetical protein
MTTTFDNDRFPVPLESRLDLLVDGELDDDERRALLDRLDTEPDGWKRCALAFLEAQCWGEALRPVAAEAARPVVISQSTSSRAVGRFRTPVTLAAGMLLAFAVGWGVRGGVAPRLASGPVAKLPASAATDPRPVTVPAPRDTPEPVPPAPSVATLEPLVKEWQRRGYRVEHNPRVVSMELRNGRKLDVPVEEVRLKFVGDRIY